MKHQLANRDLQHCLCLFQAPIGVSRQRSGIRLFLVFSAMSHKVWVIPMAAFKHITGRTGSQNGSVEIFCCKIWNILFTALQTGINSTLLQRKFIWITKRAWTVSPGYFFLSAQVPVKSLKASCIGGCYMVCIWRVTLPSLLVWPRGLLLLGKVPEARWFLLLLLINGGCKPVKSDAQGCKWD